MTGSVFQKWQPAYAEHRIATFPCEEVGYRSRKRTKGRCASKPPRQLTFLKFNNAGVAARNCPTSLHDIEPTRAIHRGEETKMTSIEERLIGRISAQLTRAVEEADQAYEFAPSSYTAGALNALLTAQELVRELANASGCHRD